MLFRNIKKCSNFPKNQTSRCVPKLFLSMNFIHHLKSMFKNFKKCSWFKVFVWDLMKCSFFHDSNFFQNIKKCSCVRKWSRFQNMFAFPNYWFGVSENVCISEKMIVSSMTVRVVVIVHEFKIYWKYSKLFCVPKNVLFACWRKCSKCQKMFWFSNICSCIWTTFAIPHSLQYSKFIPKF